MRDERQETTGAASRVRATTRLALGLALMAAGALFTLDRLDLIDARPLLRYWPAALLAVGAARLLSGQVSSALGWLLIGSWLLANSLGWLDLRPWDAWPVLLFLVGARLVWRAASGPRPAAAEGEANDTLSALAIMGGVERKNHSPAFRGGDMVAVMGGCQIDLRQARIDGDEAVLDVFALMGGHEILVPEGWSIVIKVVPVMGGVEDATRAPIGGSGPRLVITGLVVMGGVEVHH